MLLLVGGAVALPTVLAALEPAPAGKAVSISYDALHQAALRGMPVTLGVNAAAVPDFVAWVTKLRQTLTAKRGSVRVGGFDYPAALAIEYAVAISALRAAKQRLAFGAVGAWFDDDGGLDALGMLEASLRGMSGYDVPPATYAADAMRALASAAAEMDAAHVLFDGAAPGDVSVIDSIGVGIDKLPDTLGDAAGAVAGVVGDALGSVVFSAPVLLGAVAIIWWRYA